MQVKTYSPSVEVYAAVKTKDGYDYLDLSPDVVSCTVSRNVDAASTFSIKLQNVNHKYNGRLLPFDRISISCTKDERMRLIVGYITSAPAYTMYGSDVTIVGACPIYRLEQLYWDPYLVESYNLLGYAGSGVDNWGDVVFNLLINVAGYSEEQVIIGDMPKGAMDFAYEMYQANLDSANQLTTMVDEFYEVLRTHGPKAASGGSSTNVPQTGGGGFSLLGDGVSFDVSKEKFVAEWGPRIDAYIERVVGTHSPVYGKGNVYAEAAWIGRMDPRWLPVIGFFETTCGTAASHAGSTGNLYGWGCHDSGEVGVARQMDDYDSFIHYILDNAGTRENGWGGANVLNAYTDLAELDAEYCSSSASRIGELKNHMASI